jgi:nucleoid DNA-binding protein
MKSINGRSVLELSKEELHEMFHQETGLSLEIISLLVESFYFFLKKSLFENGKISQRTIGSFHIVPYKIKCDEKRAHSIIFRPSRTFKSYMKDGKTGSAFYVIQSISQYFPVIGQMFGMEPKIVRSLYIFYLRSFLYCLRKYECFKMKNFGIFYSSPIEERYKKSYFAKLQGNVTSKLFKFQPDLVCLEQIWKKKKLYVSSRLARMLFLAGVDRKPNYKTYDRKINTKTIKLSSHRNRKNFNDFKKSK